MEYQEKKRKKDKINKAANGCAHSSNRACFFLQKLPMKAKVGLTHKVFGPYMVTDLICIPRFA